MRFKDRPPEPARDQFQLCCSKCRTIGSTLMNLKSVAKALFKNNKISKMQLKNTPDRYMCRACAITTMMESRKGEWTNEG